MKYWHQKIIGKWLQPEYKFLYVFDLPENVRDKTIYIVGDKGCPWLIAFKCPCGCQTLIQLNLLKEATPCWSFKVKKREIDISPSILRTQGCESHFVVHKNKVYWVGRR